jgi:hypothetical protein
MVDHGDINGFALKPILVNNFIKQVSGGILDYNVVN